MDIQLFEGDNIFNVSLEPEPKLATLYGKVIDSTNRLPISGVNVTIDGKTASTNSIGEYIFTALLPGTYSIFFQKEGYYEYSS